MICTEFKVCCTDDRHKCADSQYCPRNVLHCCMLAHFSFKACLQLSDGKVCLHYLFRITQTSTTATWLHFITRKFYIISDRNYETFTKVHIHMRTMQSASLFNSGLHSQHTIFKPLRWLKCCYVLTNKWELVFCKHFEESRGGHTWVVLRLPKNHHTIEWIVFNEKVHNVPIRQLLRSEYCTCINHVTLPNSSLKYRYE